MPVVHPLQWHLKEHCFVFQFFVRGSEYGRKSFEIGSCIQMTILKIIDHQYGVRYLTEDNERIIADIRFFICIIHTE